MTVANKYREVNCFSNFTLYFFSFKLFESFVIARSKVSRLFAIKLSPPLVGSAIFFVIFFGV